MVDLRRSPPVSGLRQVTADLPSSVARQLDTSEIEAVVRTLMGAGWRPVQLSARIGMLPATDNPAVQVLAFLTDLTGHESPLSRVERERAERVALAERTALAERAAGTDQAPASAEARARWIAQARSGLKGSRSRVAVRPVPVTMPVTAVTCALCDCEGRFFVTREVHLCDRCVAVLATGRARLDRSG